MNQPPRLLLRLRLSRHAVAIIVVTHATTAALLMWLPIPWGMRLVGAAVVASACAFSLCNAVGRSSVASLQVGIERRIWVVARSGRERSGEVLADSYVGSRLTTIVWQPDDAWMARTILILPDSLSADDFRQLRVVLRYARAPPVPSGSSDADAERP